MKLFTPKLYQESIYTIDYDKLKKRNIKCLLFDLDNTCIGYKEKTPTKELENLFNTLTKKGFKVIIFTITRQQIFLYFYRIIMFLEKKCVIVKK